MTSPSKPSIPYGFCHCGCGQLAKIATRAYVERGWTAGEPRPFLRGHNRRRPFEYRRGRYAGDHVVFIKLQDGSETVVSACDFQKVKGICWTKSKGYAVGKVNGHFIPMHRFLLGLAADNPLDGEHENLNRLDNRRGNIRRATRQQNLQNLPVKKCSTTGIKGVIATTMCREPAALRSSRLWRGSTLNHAWREKHGSSQQAMLDYASAPADRSLKREENHEPRRIQLEALSGHHRGQAAYRPQDRHTLDEVGT